MSETHTTTDHSEIKTWVNDREGYPARVKSSQSGDEGILRIGFQNPEGDLEKISWEDFFKDFEKDQLAFLHSSASDSRFCKLVSRD